MTYKSYSVAIEFLVQMQVTVYKIASFELVDLPLIARVAQTGNPLIMFTGMATAPIRPHR